MDLTCVPRLLRTLLTESHLLQVRNSILTAKNRHGHGVLPNHLRHHLRQSSIIQRSLLYLSYDENFSYIRSFHASPRTNLISRGVDERNIFLGCLIRETLHNIVFWLVEATLLTNFEGQVFFRTQQQWRQHISNERTFRV